MKVRTFVGFFLVALCAVFLCGARAVAQTAATLGEKIIGSTDCSNGASAADFDTLAQCTSTTTTMGTMQKAPLFVGAVTAPPYASVDCDATKSGLIQYSATYGDLVCDGTTWGPLVQKNPAVGSVMPDGTIYAGGGLYTTPCDIGLSGTQASCTGTHTALTFAGFMAYCGNLNSYGHQDWFFPQLNELFILYTNKAAIGGFDTSGSYYYMSTYESAINGTGYMWVIKFSDATIVWAGLANTAAYGRCIRR